MRLRARSWLLTGGLLLAVAGVALFGRFPVSGVADELSGWVEARLCVRLETGAASFNLLRGLRVDDVVARATSERLILAANIDRLVLQHQRSPSTSLRIRRIVLHDPSIDLTIGRQTAVEERAPNPDDAPIDESAAASVAPDPPEQTRTSFLRFDGASIKIVGASIAARLPTSNAYPLAATALDASLADVAWNRTAPSLLHRLSATGRFSAEELWLGRVRVRRARGDLTMGDGHVLIDRLMFTCDDSDFFLPELDIDFSSDPFSLGTSSNVFARPPDSASPDDWSPVTSFALLGELCKP